MTTEDSTENMPDKLTKIIADGRSYANHLYETEQYQPWEVVERLLIQIGKMHSQAELDRRVAEAEERQRERCWIAAKEVYKNSCCDYYAPAFMKEAILNAGGKGDE